ncbi:MAG: FG-GAP repeat domain-containing protein [Pyrinomonadaceae bacterium]
MNRKLTVGILSILLMLMSVAFINIVSAENDSNQGISSRFADTPLLVEDFTYPAGSLLTSNGWTAHSGGGTNPIVTSSPGLTLTGYPSSGIGNAVTLATSGEDVNRPFAVQSSGSVYAAFMVNVSEATTDPAGGYFFHLGPDPVGTTFRGRVSVKKNDSNALAFGISKAATASADIAFTPFNYALNTTYLLIVKYTIVDGASNDTVSLFVSTTTPASEPAPTASATDITSQTDINPGTVSLRQGSTATSPTARVDGIRVGTTYASVTAGMTGGGTPTPSPTVDAPVDFNGDGKTDYAVVRNVGGATGSGSIPPNQIRWFYNINGSTAPTVALDWGLAGDRFVPEDYDGDGKDDIAVWRPGAPTVAAFYILNSATNTARVEAFGQTGDNPTVVGDYNGDGRADLAVYRDGTTANAQSFWFYRTTPGGPTTFIRWGLDGDFPAPGDYDGDGRNDFVIQRDPGTGQKGEFWTLLATGVVQPVRTFGLPDDFIVTGDFDGDRRTDLATLRLLSTGLDWYWQRSSDNVIVGPINFGFPPSEGAFTDIPAPGDYEGDGRKDIGVWRVAAGQFIWRSTATGAVTFFRLGAAGDFPVAFYNVH